MVVTNPQPNEKNLVGVKSIEKSVPWFASYRFGALTVIGRLCSKSGKNDGFLLSDFQ